LVDAISKLKMDGATVIITTHRPRLVGVVDKLLVLRGGQQVGFGPAQSILESVRNLQGVPMPAEATKQPSSSSNTEVLKS